MEVKWRQNGARMGSRRRQSRRKKPMQQKRGFPLDPFPYFGRKSVQHGPKLAPKMEPRWLKNRSKNRSFFFDASWDRVLARF